MHILLLTPNFPPEVNAGASRAYEHCLRWVQAGAQVTVVTTVPNWPAGKVYDGYRNHWRGVESVDGIRVIRVWTFVWPNRGLLGRTLSFTSFMLRATLCASRLRGVDLLVATSPHFFCGQAGMLSRWLTGLPFVLEVRDIWPESVVAVGAMRRSLVIRGLEWLEQRMYASATHIVTVGEGYRRQLLRRGVQPERLSVIPNGVDLSRWHPRTEDTELRERWRGTGRFVCAYVGTVGMAHGLEVVLRAAQQLKEQDRDDIMFWIVGDGAMKARLAETVQRRQLENVLVTGQVTKEKVATVIASCDACLVHLRGTELFSTVMPSKIFEIMAMNKPIIMGVRGPAQEAVLSAQAGVAMVPEDEESLLACVEQVSARRGQLSSGRQYVSERFNRDEFAQQMLDLLHAYAGPQEEPAPEFQTEMDSRRSAA